MWHSRCHTQSLTRTVEKTVPELGGAVGNTVERTAPAAEGAVSQTVEKTVTGGGAAVSELTEQRLPTVAKATPNVTQPAVLYSYENRAYVAPHTGFEVQLGSPQPGAEPGIFEGVLLGDAPVRSRTPRRPT
jgi:hypothetical protein